MHLPILSGLIVSVDAFFIGLSLGLQRKCKFYYLAIINAVLFGLCMLGFLMAAQLYEHIAFDTDLMVGLSFIALGVWTVLHCFINKRKKEEQPSRKTIVLVGLVMSAEAMLITMGLTFIFLPGSTFLIPVTVALAHFGYAALSFHLARTRHAKRIPVVFSHVISGLALIAYGLMAIFIEV